MEKDLQLSCYSLFFRGRIGYRSLLLLTGHKQGGANKHTNVFLHTNESQPAITPVALRAC